MRQARPSYQEALLNCIFLIFASICVPATSSTIKSSNQGREIARSKGSDAEFNLKTWGRQLCCGKSATLVRDPSSASNDHVLRISLEKQDGVRRAELHNAKETIKLNYDYWYAFDIYIPQDWAEDTTSEIIAQWHSKLDKALGERNIGGPPLAIRVQGDMLEIHSRWDSAQVTRSIEGSEVLWAGSIEKGRWIRWIINAKWSYTSTGRLKVWKDGTRIVNHKGPNCTNDKAGGPYFKFGIYKPSWGKRTFRNEKQKLDRKEDKTIKRRRPDSIVGKRIIYYNNIIMAEGDMGVEQFKSLYSSE